MTLYYPDGGVSGRTGWIAWGLIGGLLLALVYEMVTYDGPDQPPGTIHTRLARTMFAISYAGGLMGFVVQLRIISGGVWAQPDGTDDCRWGMLALLTTIATVKMNDSGAVSYTHLLYDKIGISIDTISRGSNSGVFSSTNKFTKGEREAILNMMEDTYEQFTSKAAAGRDMPVEQLVKLAGGKVYTGRQAKANGLVDELGTLDDALAAAKQLAGIEEDKEVKIMTLPKSPDLFESLLGGNEAEKEVEVKVDLGLGDLHPEMKKLIGHAKTIQRVFHEPVVLMLPFSLEIK